MNRKCYFNVVCLAILLTNNSASGDLVIIESSTGSSANSGNRSEQQPAIRNLDQDTLELLEQDSRSVDLSGFVGALMLQKIFTAQPASTEQSDLNRPNTDPPSTVRGPDSVATSEAVSSEKANSYAHWQASGSQVLMLSSLSVAQPAATIWSTDTPINISVSQ